MNCSIELFSTRTVNGEKTQYVFKVTDPNNRETLLVINVKTDDEKKNFKNLLLVDNLAPFVENNRTITWLEIESLITRVSRLNVVIL